MNAWPKTHDSSQKNIIFHMAGLGRALMLSAPALGREALLSGSPTLFALALLGTVKEGVRDPDRDFGRTAEGYKALVRDYLGIT